MLLEVVGIRLHNGIKISKNSHFHFVRECRLRLVGIKKKGKYLKYLVNTVKLRAVDWSTIQF